MDGLKAVPFKEFGFFRSLQSRALIQRMRDATPKMSRAFSRILLLLLNQRLRSASDTEGLGGAVGHSWLVLVIF